jgi:hypothetical protein
MIKGMAKRGAKRLFFLLRSLGLGLFCLIATTCNIDLSINSNYQDKTRNWIPDLGFDHFNIASSTSWAFDYVGQTGDSYAYMTLADTGAVVSGTIPDGLSTSAEAYRLSINNLMPDPDFALGTVASRWGVGHEGALVTDPAAPTIAGSGIHGNCLTYSRPLAGQYVRLLLSDDLYNSGGAGAGPVNDSMYQINFLFKGSSAYLSYSHDLTDEGSYSISPGAISEVRLQTQTFASSAVDYSLYFGPKGAQSSAYVDDIRVVRKIIPLYLSLNVKPSDTSLAFISGRYVFSVWVKNDPSASYLLDASAAAPYQARAVTLEIRSLAHTDGGTIAVKTPDDAVTGWSDWTRLRLEFPTGEKLAIDQTDTDPIFSLKISPADLMSATGLDAATILIAQPTLTFEYQ